MHVIVIVLEEITEGWLSGEVAEDMIGGGAGGMAAGVV